MRRVRHLLPTMLLLAGILQLQALGWAQSGPQVDLRNIHLKTVGAFDPREGVPALSGLPSVGAYQPRVRGGFLVQFDRPIGAAERAAIEHTGASIKGYLPMMTLEVVMTNDQQAAVAAIQGVRWVGVYQPSFKVRSELVRELAAKPGTKVKLQVSLFPGEQGRGVGALRGLGAQVLNVDRGRSFEVVQVEIPAGQLNALVLMPQVRFIEPVYERKELNDRSRKHTGLTAIADDQFLNGIDPALDGSSGSFRVKYGHFDGGFYSGHNDFTKPHITVEPGSTTSGSATAHGTHTAGSIVGDGGESMSVPAVPPGSGSVSPDKWRGVTPDADLHHISFSTGYSDRQVFEREVEEGAHISSNSWGYCKRRGPFRCPSITDYNANAAMWDEGVWDADDDQPGRQPLITFFSAGNDGNGSSSGCGTSSADQVGTPGTAKNVITVAANETDRGCGADGDNVGEVGSYSSRGPVDPDGSGQGLFKPDVTNIGGFWVLSVEAPGTGGSGVDAPSSCSNTGSLYRYEVGTSMSNPLTAGLGGVVLQDLVVNQDVNFPKPRPSLIKALLINGAVTRQPNGGCSYTLQTNQTSIAQGWGMPDARNSLYGPGGSPLTRNVEFENEENAVATGSAYDYSKIITANPGTPLNPHFLFEPRLGTFGRSSSSIFMRV